jgi:hypothetical protein
MYVLQRHLKYSFGKGPDNGGSMMDFVARPFIDDGTR